MTPVFEKMRPWGYSLAAMAILAIVVSCGEKSTGNQIAARPCKPSTGANASKAQTKDPAKKTDTKKSSAKLTLTDGDESQEDSDDTGAEDEDSLGLADDKVGYTDTIKPLMDQHCVGCHKKGGSSSLMLDTYDNVKTSVDKSISRMRNASNPMPIDKLLPDKEVAKLVSWKKFNLLETAESAAPTATGTKTDSKTKTGTSTSSSAKTQSNDASEDCKATSSSSNSKTDTKTDAKTGTNTEKKSATKSNSGNAAKGTK